jgi:AcrR family transcriptional regulator
MGRPRQITDEQILKAAQQCFLEQGPGVSTTVIARQIGVSQAALFKRFGTKEELMVRALIDFERPPWIERVQAGPDPGRGDLRRQLRDLMGTLWESMKEMMPRMAVLRASGMPMQQLVKRFKTPPPVHIHRALSAWLRKAEQQGKARVRNPEHLALVVTGAVQGRSFFKYGLEQRFTKKDDEAFLQSLTDLIWNTISTEDRK